MQVVVMEVWLECDGVLEFYGVLVGHYVVWYSPLASTLVEVISSDPIDCLLSYFQSEAVGGRLRGRC